MENEDIVPIPDSINFDVTEQKKQVFGMYVGKAEWVSIVLDNTLIDTIMDKFGEDV